MTFRDIFRTTIIAFIEYYAMIDRIIDHLKLSFTAEYPPPPHAQEEPIIEAEERGDYF